MMARIRIVPAWVVDEGDICLDSGQRARHFGGGVGGAGGQQVPIRLLPFGQSLRAGSRLREMIRVLIIPLRLE